MSAFDVDTIIKGKMISHKGIEMGVVTDAPFVGARICAMDCHCNCPGCFNQELRQAPYTVESVYKVIDKIKQHGLDQGIILGGLEWSEQPDEMLALIHIALNNRLKVMVYTHHDLLNFLKMFPQLTDMPIYVKCGEYKKELKPYMDSNYDVYLASSNQRIYYLGN